MTSHHGKLIVLEAVTNFRVVVQQLIALHLKRQRDHIVRLRRQFYTRLSRRLRRNISVYRRQRQQLERDVATERPERTPKLVRVVPLPQDVPLLREVGLTAAFDNDRLNMLRMDSETFGLVCELVKDELLADSKPPTLDDPSTLEMQVGIALYVLGTGEEYRMVGKKFDLHFTTVRKYVHSFCQALVKMALTSEIRMPTDTNGLEAVIKEFEDFVGIPQIVGILDCLHVAINQPTGDTKEYLNSKGWNSLVLQAVVDRKGRFMDISCKHPGKANDETVLLQTSLYTTMEDQVHPFDQPRMIDKKAVHPFLLGDKGYPLLPWLITPYFPGKLSSAEYSFNVYAAKARNVVGTAFERLTGRWKVLDRCLNANISVVPDIIASCCILHNITERCGSQYKESWSDCPSVDDATPTQPQWSCGIVTTEGEEIRNHLAKYMATNYPKIDEDED